MSLELYFSSLYSCHTINCKYIVWIQEFFYKLVINRRYGRISTVISNRENWLALITFHWRYHSNVVCIIRLWVVIGCNDSDFVQLSTNDMKCSLFQQKIYECNITCTTHVENELSWRRSALSECILVYIVISSYIILFVILLIFHSYKFIYYFIFHGLKNERLHIDGEIKT